MSAPGRIPVVVTDPKIEERLRRKREKQRIYDRRRREASTSGAQALKASISEEGEADSGSEAASSSTLKKITKSKAGPSLRRHSMTSAHVPRHGRSGQASELSVQVRKASVGSLGSPAILAGPNVLAGSPISTGIAGHHGPADALATPVSGNNQHIGHSKAFRQSPGVKAADRELSPNSQISMYYSTQASPVSPMPHHIAIAGPLPSGTITKIESGSPGSPAYQSDHSRGSGSPSAGGMAGAGAKAGASPKLGVSSGTNSATTFRKTSPRSLSLPTLHSAAPAARPRTFLVPASLNERSRRFSVAHDTYADMLAADFGIDPVGVDASAVASDAGDTLDASEWDDRPLNFRLESGDRFDLSPDHEHDNEHEDERELSADANFRLETMFGQTAHYIAEPRLPEPVGLDFIGAESAHESLYESVYESFYESAFEDESPPDLRARETLPSLRSPEP